MQDDQLIRRLQQQIDFKLTGLQDYDSLDSTLRNVRLKGDGSVRIYEHAVITPKKYLIDDLSPLSLYVLDTQLAQHKKLFWHLSQYGQNLFDLVSMMSYTQARQLYTIAPPIIETYQEPTTGEPIAAIIDGLHRIYAARQLGFDELWVIEIAAIPRLLPPISLPIPWDEVTVYNHVPPADAKRRYRYTRPSDYPNLSAITSEPVTSANYQYFLYRDFSALGSDGIRQSTSGEKSTSIAGCTSVGKTFALPGLDYPG